MGLVDLTIKDYLDILKTNVPAPGGGSVSALSGAQGMGLIMMVADLTIGREKYAGFQEVCIKAKTASSLVLNQLIEGIDKDTEAYNLVCDACQLPKSCDEEKAERSRCICEATYVATKVPFETMELGLRGLQIAEGLVGNSNPNCSSDLGVAALNLIACVKGAWLNVLINLPGLKDPDKEEDFRIRGRKICKEAEALAAKIYEEVVENL